MPVPRRGRRNCNPWRFARRQARPGSRCCPRCRRRAGRQGPYEQFRRRRNLNLIGAGGKAAEAVRPVGKRLGRPHAGNGTEVALAVHAFERDGDAGQTCLVGILRTEIMGVEIGVPGNTADRQQAPRFERFNRDPTGQFFPRGSVMANCPIRGPHGHQVPMVGGTAKDLRKKFPNHVFLKREGLTVCPAERLVYHVRRKIRNQFPSGNGGSRGFSPLTRAGHINCTRRKANSASRPAQ